MQTLINRIPKIAGTTIVAIFCLLSAGGLSASEFPPLIFPAGVGVNIHFVRGHERDLDLIAAAGFKFIRMDFNWEFTEREKGVYDWSAYDELTDNLEKRNIRPLYIIGYTNSVYDQPVVSKSAETGKEKRYIPAPQNTESITAFANWAAAATKHFKGRHVVWEIWNEPDGSSWKPKVDVKQYVALALAASRAMRAEDPQATIIAPAATGSRGPFLENALASGLLEYIDGVSIHPYRHRDIPPETVNVDFMRVRRLIERYAPPSRKSLPVISGECGYATHTKGVTLDVQAAFIARQQLYNVLNGVPISIWYDWMNDGDKPDYNEHNFGITSADLTPKPSYVAVQTLNAQLSGFHIAHRLHTDSDSDFVLLLVNDSGVQKLVAWTLRNSHSITYDAGVSAADVAAVDGQGKQLEIKDTVGSLLAIDLQSAPQYITLKQPSRKLSASASWSLGTPVPALITGGDKTGVGFSVRVKNPFSKPLRVKFALDGEAGQPSSANFAVDPHKTTTKVLHFATTRRNVQQIEAALKVEIFENSGRLLHADSETHSFTLSNPLLLSVAQTERALCLVIDNPLLCSFTGSAIISDAKLPVKLDEAIPQCIISVPLSTGSANITGSLTDTDGRIIGESLNSRIQPLSPLVLNTRIGGDLKVPATANLTETDAPGDATKPFAKAFRLDYSLEVGYSYLECMPSTEMPIAGNPKALGLWIYGDGSGNWFHTRVIDATGQYFQAGTASLDWIGWRWVTIDLSRMNDVEHWGGANDGQIHGELKLGTLLLINSINKKTESTIFFAGPALLY